MHYFLTDMLRCPACRGALSWRIARRDGVRIEEGEAHCAACGAAYPVREGIGVFLTTDLTAHDLWEGSGGRLSGYMRERPEIERRLMGGPPEELDAPDLFYRALALEERGRYAEARAASESAYAALYAAEYRECYSRQLEYAVERLRAGGSGPIVDLASGRGTLAEVLLRGLERPVVATDLSPAVLRRDRAVLESLGLYERASLLAFDARRTPFKDGAVETMSTSLGLGNVEEPDRLLRELRRVVSGSLLVISHFYPEDDGANVGEIHARGLPLLLKSAALEALGAAGWDVEVSSLCSGTTRPTGRSALLGGAGIDALPVSEIALEWCTLVAC